MTNVRKYSDEETGARRENALLGTIICMGFVVILVYFGIPILARWEPDNFHVSDPLIVVSGVTEASEEQVK